jgi:glycosyltransferase involved in cell wall biosynthesis
MTDIAVAHKDYDVRGGGEMLVETLAAGFDCPLIVGHANQANQPTDRDIDIRELAPGSRWHRLANRGGLPRAVAHMMLWRDAAPDALAEFDTVITSGNEPQWWLPREEQTVIAYTHTTPRFLYDLSHDAGGVVARTAQQAKRWLFEQELETGVDLWVANSEVVARRMERYWQLNSDDIRVVYPPIETDTLSPINARTQDYYLTLGRLGSIKRVEEAIRAANQHGFCLKVAGDGPEADRLAALAGPTVEMCGWVSGERKRELLAGSRGLINCCRAEDFGMAVCEALAAGTPVLTVSEGMPQHLISDGETGIVFARGELGAAVARLERDGVALSEREIAAWAAETFGVERFLSDMDDAVAEAQRRSTIQAQFGAPQRQRTVGDGAGER